MHSMFLTHKQRKELKKKFSHIECFRCTNNGRVETFSHTSDVSNAKLGNELKKIFSLPRKITLLVSQLQKIVTRFNWRYQRWHQCCQESEHFHQPASDNAHVDW